MFNEADFEREFERENWFFTFGSCHTDKLGMPLHDRFVVVSGTYNSARKEVIKRRGIKFAFQYDEKEFKPLQAKYGLKEINIEAVTFKPPSEEKQNELV